MTESKFKPGEVWKTRDGSMARIYAVDGGTLVFNAVDGPTQFPMHGAVFSETDGWVAYQWDEFGKCWSPRNSIASYSAWDLIKPWVEPAPKPRMLCWLNQGRNLEGVVPVFYPDGTSPTPSPYTQYTRAPWLDPPEEKA